MIAQNAGAQQSLWQKVLNTDLIGNVSLDDILGGIQNRIGPALTMATTGAMGFFIKYGPILAKLNRTELFKAMTALGKNMDFITKIFSIQAGFAGKMKNIYNTVKGLIPHGNVSFMKNMKFIGKAAMFFDTIVSTAKSGNELITAVRTGNFRPFWDQVKETGATFLVDKFVYAGVALAAAGATVATATIGGKVLLIGTAAIVGSELIQGGGSLLASGLEFFGKKDSAKWIRDSLPSIDLKKGAIEKIKYAIDGTVNTVQKVVANPRAAVQESVDFLSKKKDEAVSAFNTAKERTVEGAKYAYEQSSKVVRKAVDGIIQDLKDQLRPEKILQDILSPKPRWPLPCPPQSWPAPTCNPPWIVR
jgi:hypothetical protein